MWKSALISTVALLLLGAAGAPALTIHVPDDQPSIQAGVDAASAGDTVLVTCDTYYEWGIVMKSGVTLTSETGEAGCVTIDAQEIGRVLSCSGVGEGAVVRGFTLTGGAAFAGGGVSCHDGSTLRFENVVVQGNRGVWGGGMWCGGGATPDLVEVAFVGNQADDGGGIALVEASPDWDGVLFSGNSASMRGGGLFCLETGAGSVLEFCTFSGNSAANGGGLYLDGDSSPDVVNCTFVGNSATEHGGGVYCEYPSFALFLLSLIAFSVEGEGLYSVGLPVVYTCDVFGNAGGEYGGTIGDQTGMNANISDDPWFCDASEGDFTIHDVSPCAPANNVSGLLIGAHGVECYAASVDEGSTLSTSWGRIKAMSAE